MEIFCVKCKMKTDTYNIEKTTTKNNKMAIRGTCKICGIQKYMFISKNEGGNLDTHKLIGKLPKPSKSFVAPGYQYLGPYNPLHKQVEFNENGEIKKTHTMPKSKLDEIAMNHDICYTINPKIKGDCDRQMVKSIDEMPYKDTNKMAMLARTIINKKQQLGLGVKKKTTRK